MPESGQSNKEKVKVAFCNATNSLKKINTNKRTEGVVWPESAWRVCAEAHSAGAAPATEEKVAAPEGLTLDGDLTAEPRVRRLA